MYAVPNRPSHQFSLSRAKRIQSLKRIILTLVSIALAFGIQAVAQITAPANPDNILTPADPIGTPPGVSADGTNESVNLSNGGLTIYIPLLSVPQLGGWSLPFAFVHSSNGYYLQQNVTATPQLANTDGESQYLSSLAYQDVMVHPDPAFNINLPRLQASEEYEGDYEWYSSLDGENLGTGVTARFCLTNFRFTDWQGDVHPFAITQSCNQPSGVTASMTPTTEGESTDGSFYMIDLSNVADIKVISMSGTVYHFFGMTAPYPNPPTYSTGGSNAENWYDRRMGEMTDADGNSITYSGGVLTDTFGRTFNVTGSGITYTDSNNSTQSITLSVTGSGTSVTDVFQYLGTGETNASSPAIYCQLMQTLTDRYINLGVTPGTCGPELSPGATGYNATITYPAAGTGGVHRQISVVMDAAQRITKITYPTGGYTRYDYRSYGYSPWNSNIVSTALLSEVNHKYECPNFTGTCSSEYVTTYAPSIALSQDLEQAYNQSIAVTDPLGNVTTTLFSPILPQQIAAKPITVSKQDKNNNLLWQQVTAYYPAPSLLVPTDLFYPQTITTYLEDVSPAQSSVVTYTSYQPFVGTGLFAAGTGVTTDQPTGITETDYNGANKRTTTQQWSSLNTFSASEGHILDRPLTKTVTDSVKSLSNSTQYTYDQGANTVGNLTQKVVTATNAPTATTTYSYNSYGQVISTTDPNSHTTSFGYGFQWGDTSCVPSNPPTTTSPYITSVTDALNEITNYWYNSCLGTIAEVKDPNLQPTFYSYDYLQRVTSVTYPDTGKKLACYFDATPNTLVTYSLQALGGTLPSCTTTTATSTGSVDQSVVLDGFGRKSESTLMSDPDGATSTVTSYDGDGNVESVTIPFRNVAQSGYTTSYQYDGLNRKRFAYNPDSTSENSSSFEEWSYSGNVVTFQDENGNQWQRTSDVMGNLIQLLEPNGSSPIPSMVTNYTYDGFNNLWSVSQWGGSTNSTGTRARYFMYDGMSRLRSAANPESGTVTYVYDAAGNLTSKTSPAPNTTIASELTVTTNYGYDALNRITSKWYTNDNYKTPWTCFQFGLPGLSGANQIGRLISEWTQPYNAGSCNSTSGFLTLRKYVAYDAMGRVTQEQQCTPSNCSATSQFSLSNSYDLAGNLLTYTSGIPNTPGAGSSPLTFTQGFGAAGRLLSLTSSWSDALHPPLLLSVPILSPIGYAPQGSLANATFGNGTALNRTYDTRLRINTETVTGVDNAVATPGSATVAITGTEQNQ